MTLPSKTLWLTFDDGPEDTYSPRVLDVLRHYRIFATFFCLGSQVEKFPAIVQRMHDEGHLVGNHSWDHPHLLDMPLDEVYQQVTKTSEAILRVLGYRPHLFRPPYGERSSPLVGHLATVVEHKGDGMRSTALAGEVGGAGLIYNQAISSMAPW